MTRKRSRPEVEAAANQWLDLKHLKMLMLVVDLLMACKKEDVISSEVNISFTIILSSNRGMFSQSNNAAMFFDILNMFAHSRFLLM